MDSKEKWKIGLTIVAVVAKVAYEVVREMNEQKNNSQIKPDYRRRERSYY